MTLRLACAIAFACSVWAVPGVLRAEQPAGEPQPTVRADELFIAGKQRLAENDYVSACPLLAQSYQLDPATGSLLALALCHERQGKLASALREYEEAAERAHTEQRPDRERAALIQIANLKPRVSTLTLRPHEPSATRIVRVNGRVIPAEQVGRALPTDGGFVLVEAEGDGNTSWRTSLTIAESGQALTVAIPLLSSAAAKVGNVVEPAAAHQAAVTRPARRSISRAAEAPRLSTLQRTGIALMASGAVGAGVAIGFTVRAIHKDKDSDRGCFDDLCTKSARRDRLDARSAGNIATVATAVAAAAAAGGLVAYLVGTKRKNDEREGRSLRLRASGWLDRESAGAAVSGAF